MDKCEKCGTPLTPYDLIPCDLEGEECPLVKMFNDELRKVMANLHAVTS